MRHRLQLLWFLLTNAYYQGFTQGTIYQGKGKLLCAPGLNCYSCPGALGACPVGAIQATLTGAEKSIPYYALGFLLFFGTLLGRGVCAVLCPFGFLQDLCFKLHPKSWKKTFQLPKIFRFLPYVITLIFVIGLPLFATNQFGISSPAFCKFICPSGTFFGGIPLLSLNEGLRATIGALFNWKLTLLLLIILWSIVEYRPFCKYLCPLGAFYGLFNSFSLYRMEYTPSSCTHCGLCKKSCGMNLDVTQTPNHKDCVRCGDCVKSCPHSALSLTFTCKNTEVSPEVE